MPRKGKLFSAANITYINKSVEGLGKIAKNEKVSSPIINCQYVGVMLVLCWCYVDLYS